MRIDQVVAIDEEFGIGKSDLGLELPWDIPSEFEHFIQVATERTAEKPKVGWVMGRRTYELSLESDIFSSLNVPFVFFVLSRTLDKAAHDKEDVVVCRNWQEVEESVALKEGVLGSAWNIGGPGVYKAQLDARTTPINLHISKIKAKFQCDLFYPKLDLEKMEELTNSDNKWTQAGEREENGIKFSCHVYKYQGN